MNPLDRLCISARALFLGEEVGFCRMSTDLDDERNIEQAIQGWAAGMERVRGRGKKTVVPWFSLSNKKRGKGFWGGLD